MACCTRVSQVRQLDAAAKEVARFCGWANRARKSPTCAQSAAASGDSLASMSLNQIAGVLPAVVFPLATLVQLGRILRDRSAVGVSLTTWILFGFANLGMYVYAERYTEWQAILGTLFTAAVDFAIVALVLCRYGRSGAGSKPASAFPRSETVSPATARSVRQVTAVSINS